MSTIKRLRHWGYGSKSIVRIKGMVSTQLIDFKRDITLNEVKQGLSKYLLRYLDQTSTIISDVA